MSWEDQGRQEHGWFGSGTAPKTDQEGGSPGTGLFGTGGLDRRIQAVIYGATGALPASARRHPSAQPSGAGFERLTGLMKVWGRGARMGMASFAEHFFGRAADDPVAARLHNAAMTANLAQSHAELREAANDLAAAQQAVGLDRWSAFMADAAQRASDPATTAAIERSEQPPDPRKDAITPVYPLETVLGIGAAGLAKGVAAGLRAASGAILRQVRPARQTDFSQTIAGRQTKALSDSGRAKDPADTSSELSRAGRALQKHGGRSRSVFPPAKGNPTSVNQQGQEALDGILSDPASTTRSGNRFGGFDVIGPGGRGARFDANGVFRGFLEPSQ